MPFSIPPNPARPASSEGLRPTTSGASGEPQRHAPVDENADRIPQGNVATPQLGGLRRRPARGQQPRPIAPAPTPTRSTIDHAALNADRASGSSQYPKAVASKPVARVRRIKRPPGWRADFTIDGVHHASRSFSSSLYGERRAQWFAKQFSLFKEAESVTDGDHFSALLEQVKQLPLAFGIEPLIALARGIRRLPAQGRPAALAALREVSKPLATPGLLLDSVFAGTERVFGRASGTPEITNLENGLFETFVQTSVLKDVVKDFTGPYWPADLIQQRAKELDDSIRAAGGEGIPGLSDSALQRHHGQAGAHKQAALEYWNATVNAAAQSAYREEAEELVLQAESVSSASAFKAVLVDVKALPHPFHDELLTALARRIVHLLGDTNGAFADWLSAAQQVPEKSAVLAHFVVAGAIDGIRGLKDIAAVLISRGVVNVSAFAHHHRISNYGEVYRLERLAIESDRPNSAGGAVMRGEDVRQIAEDHGITTPLGMALLEQRANEARRQQQFLPTTM